MCMQQVESSNSQQQCVVGGAVKLRVESLESRLVESRLQKGRLQKGRLQESRLQESRLWKGRLQERRLRSRRAGCRNPGHPRSNDSNVGPPPSGGRVAACIDGVTNEKEEVWV